MKKIIIVLVLLPNVIFAQDFLSKFTKLKEEIDYISTQKQEIKTISIAPNGDWLVLYGDLGFSYNNIPKSAKLHLEKNNKNNFLIKDFDFVNDSAWVCLSRHNAFAMRYVQQNLVEELKTLNKKKENIYQFASQNEKWIIIYGKGKIASYKIEPELQKTISNLKKQKRLIKKICFSNSGWVVLFGKNDYKTHNVNQDVINELENLKKKDKKINFVVFFNAAWIIIFDDNKYLCNF